MMPLLLTLAGMLPGDGGPGGRAARAPVAVRLGDGLKGFIRRSDGPLYRAAVSGRHFSMMRGPGGHTGTARPRITGSYRTSSTGMVSPGG
jgi:hypothetical protein